MKADPDPKANAYPTRRNDPAPTKENGNLPRHLLHYNYTHAQIHEILYKDVCDILASYGACLEETKSGLMT